MAQGLQIWDSEGNLTLDSSSNIAKIIGVHTGITDVVVSSSLLNDNTGFYFTVPRLSWNATTLDISFNKGSYILKIRDSRLTVYVGVY